LGRLERRRFDQTDEPPIRAADPRDERVTGGHGPPQAVLSGFKHSHGALELELAGVRHLEFDEEVRHGPMVDPVLTVRHREEHRAGT
jgi:hypothetical protein